MRLLLAKARELEQLEIVIRDAGPTVAVAASNGFHEIVKLLLEHGADPNRSNGSRGHGLNRALMAGDTETAGMLIAHGADFDVRSKPDDTPAAVLAAYTELDDPSIVEMLREQGVDFSAVNRDGQTALTWARLRGHPDLTDALVEAGAPKARCRLGRRYLRGHSTWMATTWRR